MKPIRLEFNILTNEYMCSSGLEVYNAHSGGKKIYDETMQDDELMEVVLYYIKTYFINKNLSWDSVTYDKERYCIIAKGQDRRK